jgi:hypothetical protein
MAPSESDQLGRWLSNNSENFRAIKLIKIKNGEACINVGFKRCINKIVKKNNGKPTELLNGFKDYFYIK